MMQTGRVFVLSFWLLTFSITNSERADVFCYFGEQMDVKNASFILRDTKIDECSHACITSPSFDVDTPNHRFGVDFEDPYIVSIRKATNRIKTVISFPVSHKLREFKSGHIPYFVDECDKKDISIIDFRVNKNNIDAAKIIARNVNENNISIAGELMNFHALVAGLHCKISLSLDFDIIAEAVRIDHENQLFDFLSKINVFISNDGDAYYGALQNIDKTFTEAQLEMVYVNIALFACYKRQTSTDSPYQCALQSAPDINSTCFTSYYNVKFRCFDVGEATDHGYCELDEGSSCSMYSYWHIRNGSGCPDQEDLQIIRNCREDLSNRMDAGKGSVEPLEKSCGTCSVDSMTIGEIAAIVVIVLVTLVGAISFFFVRRDTLKLFKRSPLTNLIEEQPLKVVNCEAVHMERTVARGGYCSLHSGKLLGKTVAIKKMLSNHQHLYEAEVAIMKRLSHTNIVRLLGHDCNSRHCRIVMEFAECGDLEKVILSIDVEYKHDHAITWSHQASSALMYIHSSKPPIVHRDVKPPNMLLFNCCRLIKLCDFNISKDVRTMMTPDRGSYPWMAPEVYMTHNYTEKCDVFSFGVSMWQIFSRKKPYNDQTPPAIMDAVTNKNERPPIIGTVFPESLDSLIVKCWDKDPAARPAMEDVEAILRSTLTNMDVRELEPINHNPWSATISS